MSVLELNHVKKSFNNGELQVLQDISLSVEKGEVVAIIGPSGSGKSTLLRCATLLERIDSGEVCFDGHYAARTGDDGTAVYADKAELKQIRNYFGLVFQQFNLFPHYSVLKNVMDAPLCVQKRDRAEVEASARRTLEKMGLGDKADAYPCQLSGGQQQRVALARTLNQNPKIILADEPVASLDPITAKQVMQDFVRINKEYKISILLNIHHVELALEFDRFYDLVRWQEFSIAGAEDGASAVLGNKGYTAKNKYLPLPQEQVDASNGVLVQNPDYAN